MQDLLATGNYAPYLAQALTPPLLGATGTVGSYAASPGIGQPFGTLGTPHFNWINPNIGPFGQNVFGQQSFAPQLGQPQQYQIAAQQQQIAAVLHQLAHQAATNLAAGQQMVATLQQIAQYCASQMMTGYQAVQLLNQLAHQCAALAQASRQAGIGLQPIYGYGQQQPFGYGGVNVMPFGQPQWAQSQWGMGVNRPQ